MTQKILVTGGAGYIGSHTVRQLGEAGYDVVVYDNLSTGSAKAVLHGELVVGDLEDTESLYRIFSQHRFDAVLHFAASNYMPKYITNPINYYAKNTRNTLNLLRCCQVFGVNKLVFSSSGAVYGEPQQNPVTESCPTKPINHYGKSKLMSEWMIKDYGLNSDFKYVIIRNFNVAGADLFGRIGQFSDKASHFIKIACDAAIRKCPYVSVFGNDFPTPDGTSIRDYIHVEDLATAYVDALRYLGRGGNSQILNCGYGQGYSIKEILDRLKAISGVNFQVLVSQRREGDSACVIASSQRIRKVLGWQPKYNDLEVILRTTLAWEQKQIQINSPQLIG